MKKNFSFLSPLGLVVMLAVVACGVVLGQTIHTQAAAGEDPWVTGEHIGYFRQQTDTLGDKVIDEGLNRSASNSYNVNNFVNDVRNALYRTGNKTARQDDTGAAFIILSMLGYRQGLANQNTTAEGIAKAKVQFDRWEEWVRVYDANGWVDFNANIDYVRNTFWQGNNGGGSDPDDVALYTEPSRVYTTGIKFNNPGANGWYVLKHDCGNPVGGSSGLFDRTYNISGHTEVQYGSAIGNSQAGQPKNITVPAGRTVEFRHYVLNEGPGDAAAVRYRAWDQDTGSYYASGGPYTYSNGQERVASRNFTIPVGTPSGTQYCRHTEWQPPSSNVSTFNQWQSSGTVCVIVAVTITPSCGGVTRTPTLLDPDTAFTLTPSITFGSAAQVTAAQNQGYTMRVTVSGPSINYNNAAAASPGSVANSLERNITLGPTNTTGSYTMTYQMLDGSGAAQGTQCTTTFVIASMPYFTVPSGDVSVGAGMNSETTACAVPEHGGANGASIVSWNKGASYGYQGAGTDYAAFALNHVQAFATALNPASGSAANIPSGLAFGNDAASGAGSGDIMGGKLGSYQSCVPNYYYPPVTAITTAINTGALVPNVITSYRYAGGASIPALAIPNGTHVNIYVDGDVQLTGSITYSGSYATAEAVPSFSIIAKGNIIIDKSVSQLDGLYVAQTDNAGNRGTVYTCANGGVPVNPLTDYATFYANCNNQLTFNGSVIARRVALLRTYGTVSQPNRAAEVFNETPELWMNQKYLPSDPTKNKSAVGRYNSVTGLPPIL